MWLYGSLVIPFIQMHFWASVKCQARKLTMKSASLKDTLLEAREKQVGSHTQDTSDAYDAGDIPVPREKRTGWWAQRKRTGVRCRKRQWSWLWEWTGFPLSVSVCSIRCAKGEEGGDPAHWGEDEKWLTMPEIHNATRKGQRKCWKGGWKVGFCGCTSGSGRDYSRRNRASRGKIKPHPIKKQNN